jgi:hypothetical protein
MQFIWKVCINDIECFQTSKQSDGEKFKILKYFNHNFVTKTVPGKDPSISKEKWKI